MITQANNEYTFCVIWAFHYVVLHAESENENNMDHRMYSFFFKTPYFSLQHYIKLEGF